MLTIGRDDLECDSFRVKGSYGKTIARLFSLPVAIESTEPLTLEVTLKGSFRPPKLKRRVYWKKKFIGDFIISSVAQEWDGNKYRTRLELKQCDRTDAPDEDIPNFKWRHDLTALSQNLAETDGALIAAGRTIDPFANSWKLTTDQVENTASDNANPAVLPVSLGGTGSSDPRIGLLNLGGISSATIGLPFGVAPLGADGKVPIANLPPGSGGGGAGVVFPILVSQGGTGALDAATARANIGAVGFSVLADYMLGSDIGITVPPLSGGIVPAQFLPAPPTLASLGGVSTTTYDAGLALKLNASARSAASGVAPLGADSIVPSTFLPAPPTLASLGGVSTTTYDAGLALKLDAAARNAASGVAGLDTNSLISVNQIPLSVQFQLLARTGTVAVDFNTVSANHGGIRYFDNNVVNPNAPAIGTNGTLIQFESLFGVASNLWKAQTFIGHNSRRADRTQNNGTWGTWNEIAYLNGLQPFSTIQDFNAAARFKGGGLPAITTTLTQGGITSDGFPVYWFVNATAAAGNRLKSIIVTNNGNIQIRHHADDGTVGNIFEHTASGNILTNGTVRPGSGATAFTGASFVAGATYFRTDLLGDSGAGCATYSDGSIWRRVSDGTATTEPAKLKKTIIGTTAATQGASATVAHGLNSVKISSVSGTIQYSTGAFVSVFTRQSGYCSTVSIDSTNVNIYNEPTISGSMLSKPFSLVIEYTT